MIKSRSVRRIGPLNPLRAFEAAARHMSFTAAADELCITQGAISRAVRTLEDYFGLPLFKRLGNGLELLPRSKEFASRLTDIFADLGEATDQFQGSKAAQVVTVWTYTSFMIGFLIPRLPDFQLHHPDIKIRLISATDSAEFNRDQVDVRLRYGRGHWHGVESTLLFREELQPVCSPKLLGSNPTIRPSDLSRFTFLHNESRRQDWAEWLRQAGVPDLQPRDDLVFDELSIAYQAALSGVGVALVQTCYFKHEIEAGLLVAPFATRLRRDLGYYVTVSQELRNAERVRVFREWLLAQFETAGITDGAGEPPCKLVVNG